MSSPGGLGVKKKICLQCRRPKFEPWLGRSPGEGNGNPVFLPGEFHGQREPGKLKSMGSQRVRCD